MIEVHNLTKHYGPHVAVDNVSFSVDRGEVVGFLGPNGAGKTTTMNILTGYLSATKGDVVIDGTNILEDPEAVKSKIGYLPENPPLYPEMTVKEFLHFVCRLKKVPKDQVKQRIDSGLTTVGIVEVYNRLVGNLSKGYRQRVGLAQALMGNPDILILDEPTSGLDPKQIIEIRDLITQLGADRTVVLSSHILHEVSAICRRVMIINNGRIVADGDPAHIGQDLYDTSQVVLTLATDRPAVETLLSGISGITNTEFLPSTEPDTTEVLLESEKGTDVRPAVFEACSKAKITILGMRVKNMTLEEIFLELTSGVKEAV